MFKSIKPLQINAKLKPYKVQEMVFSCLRSKIAYENPKEIIDIFKKNGNRDIFNCKLMSCNLEIRNKIDTVLNDIVYNMNSPIFYDGSENKDNKRDSQGFMIWKYNTIYISFRGTKDICDVLDVIDIRPKKLIKDIMIHTGFFEQFMSIESMITKDIRDISTNYPIERIIFTGHSLGGSLAAISAAYYSTIFKDMQITCHTFGTPLIGNNNFVKWFKTNVDESTRVSLEEDIIPLIPINSNFKHIPIGINLKQNGNTDNNELESINYIDFINYIKNKEYKNIILNHSCEKYLERLLEAKYIRDDYKLKNKLNP